ncbi:hypothetical protein [Pseudonocardia sp. ICBG1293]|uniref:hypothetical protein n=1 Tax=Pseudonocardia sp. ICBG1293 TaxID=2844382 RepID=UPI001CCA7BB7|nr:hypothetical protein [Pseudonocardia sp. ICBG1293]
MAPPLGSGMTTDLESGRDGEHYVRRVPGGTTVKHYRCPGCDQLLPSGMPHVVTWPAEDGRGVEERRHWHLPCWNARDRRRAGFRRR